MCLQRCLSGADVVESCQVPKHDPLQRAHRGPALRLHDWWNIATCLALKKKQKNMQAPFRRGTRPRLTFWSSSWLGEGVRLGRIVSSHAVTWLWRTRQRTQGWCYKSAFVLSGAGSRTPFLVGWGGGEGHVVSVCSGPASTAQLLSYGMHVTSLACWLLGSPMFGTIGISWLRKRERMQQVELQWLLIVGFLLASNPLSTTFKSEVWLCVWGGGGLIT